MNDDLFEKLTPNQCALLFECLLHALETNAGIGFRNYDQDHPDYHDGAKQNTSSPSSDSQHNDLFQMIKELSLRLADADPSLVYKHYLITTWPALCQKALDGAKKSKCTYTPLYLRGK